MFVSAKLVYNVDKKIVYNIHATPPLPILPYFSVIRASPSSTPAFDGEGVSPAGPGEVTVCVGGGGGLCRGLSPAHIVVFSLFSVFRRRGSASSPP